MKKVILAKSLAGLFPKKDSFLERADIKVVEVTTNDDALRVCLREPVDLIVTSFDLSGMTCEQLVESVRSNVKLKQVSIIVICQDTLAHRERIKHCKANAVLIMPVNPAALLLKMQQFLNVAPRMVYRAMIAVAIEGKFQGQPLPFWTENISESGMLIQTEEPLAKGTGVFLSFFLHDGTHVTGYGEIVRDQQPVDSKMRLYGVRFTNIDESSKAALRTVLTRKRSSTPS